MEYLFIYFLQLLATFQDFSFLISFIWSVSAIALIAIGILTKFQFEKYVSKDHWDSITTEAGVNSSKIFKNILIGTSVALLLFCFIPTKNTLLLMGGAYLGKKAYKTMVTNEKIQKIDEIINLELDKMIEELKQ